jgi:hypothetical protein
MLWLAGWPLMDGGPMTVSAVTAFVTDPTALVITKV